jgi:hypothetical protein
MRGRERTETVRERREDEGDVSGSMRTGITEEGKRAQ